MGLSCDSPIFLNILFPGLKLGLDHPKAFFFTVVLDVGQEALKAFHGLWRHGSLVLVFLKIVIRAVLSVVFFQIGPAGRSPVTDHLADIVERHLDRAIACAIIVEPVFKVVLIPALVVEPGFRVAHQLLFLGVGRPIAFEIFNTRAKLSRRELRQVMQDPLLIKAQPKAIFLH